MLRITFVAFRERDPEVEPTALDVIKNLYRDDNAITAHRARMIPTYGDTGNFTDYEDPPKGLYMNNIDYDRSTKKSQLKELVDGEDEALEEFVDERSDFIDTIFSDIDVKKSYLEGTGEKIP